MIRDIRDILLLIHALAWLITVSIIAYVNHAVPAELWGILPFGIGAILTAFKVEGYRPKSTEKRSGDD